MVKVGRYDYKKSTRPGKKLMVEVQGKTIHFGNTSYQHYKDKTGIWSSKNHNDSKRRASYRARHGAIKLKSGKRAVDDPTKPAYHSWHVLWS
jgi:hypothetical protein